MKGLEECLVVEVLFVVRLVRVALLCCLLPTPTGSASGWETCFKSILYSSSKRRIGVKVMRRTMAASHHIFVRGPEMSGLSYGGPTKTKRLPVGCRRTVACTVLTCTERRESQSAAFHVPCDLLCYE
jgi:hypothetical protein